MPQSKLYVKKFGGTSVGTIERIERLAEQIAAAYQQGERQVIVCSAMAGETNRLVSLGRSISENADPREMDMLISTGEQISIALMAMALQRHGVPARSLTGDQVQIHTDSQHGHASITHVDTEIIDGLLAVGMIPVVAGFQGRNPQGDVTTLGRGGSDTTAVAIAAAINADECQIFPDVSGVYSTDPRIESQAQQLTEVSFATMHALAMYGAKVLHPDSVAYARDHGVDLRVLSSFEAGQGTLVVDKVAASGQIVGIAVVTDQVEFQFLKPQSDNEILAIINALTANKIEHQIRMFLNNKQNHVAIIIERSQLACTLSLFERLGTKIQLKSFNYKQELAQLTLVADGTLDHTKITAKVLDVCNTLNINVDLVSDSPIHVRLLLSQEHLQQAVCALHHVFVRGKC